MRSGHCDWVAQDQVGASSMSGNSTMTVTENRLRKCREHSEQCRVQAELSPHPNIREAFIAAAKEWDQIAIEIQKIERDRAFATQAPRLSP